MMNEIILQKKGKKVIPVVWTGNKSNLEYQIVLEHEGAELVLPMILLGKGDKSLILRVKVVHSAPETKAKVVIKAALNDSSSVDFEGLIKIEKDSSGVDTYLGANLLLLSDQASGRAVPNLEIETSDIKAGHGVTIGKVDENEIFYLMSRGISRKEAINLIVQGFLRSTLELFPKKKALKFYKKLKWM